LDRRTSTPLRFYQALPPAHSIPRESFNEITTLPLCARTSSFNDPPSMRAGLAEEIGSADCSTAPATLVAKMACPTASKNTFLSRLLLRIPDSYLVPFHPQFSSRNSPRQRSIAVVRESVSAPQPDQVLAARAGKQRSSNANKANHINHRKQLSRSLLS
jgi:hypothetical protein